MDNRAPKPGDFVIRDGQTALVYSVSSRTCTVMPATSQRGAARVWNVDLGVVAFSTVRGPIRVSLLQREDWPLSECVRIGAATPEHLAAIRLAALRTSDNRRIEAQAVRSATFEAAKPFFRSGGRRVGAHMTGA